MLYALILWLFSLIQHILAFCLEYVLASASHLAIQRNSSPKNENSLTIYSPSCRHDFLSSDEHKNIFLVCIMQGDRTTSETTQREHDGQVENIGICIFCIYPFT